jgi:hypothetical protein
VTAGTAVLAALAACVAGPHGQAAADPSPVTPEAAALRTAALSGERVEVLEERTEDSQVFAEPTGKLVYEASAVPQFVRQADGSWRNVALRLEAAADGSLGPAVSAVDVRFSGGGSGPFATVTRGGTSMGLVWSYGELPKPKIVGESGDGVSESAVYEDALPGADLVVRATHTGFTHSLVVKTPAAAASDRVRHLRIGLTGDARITREPDGSLQAVAGETVLATAMAPVMWDSATPAAEPRRRRPGVHSVEPEAGVPVDTSTDMAPGDAARIADVDTEVDASGDLILHADQKLLSPDSATFPVFIDPDWDVARKRWAYATSNNTNNNRTSDARVGKDPEGSRTYRSFFEFSTTGLKDKHIESAYVHMELTHSWKCVGAWTHMYHSGVISATPRTRWSPKLIKWLDARDSHAHEPDNDNCAGGPQPNMGVNFRDTKDHAHIQNLIQQVARDKKSAVTIGFCACNGEGKYEKDKKRWVKFVPGAAKLIVDYDSKPGKPTERWVGLAGSAIKCTSSTLTIGTLNPELSAKLPDADKAQKLTGMFEWVEVPASGNPDDVAPRGLGAVTATANTQTPWTDDMPTLAKNRTYAFRVRGKDPKPYELSSPNSDWCKFKVDTSVPNVTARVSTKPPGPGKPGEVIIGSTSADVTTFRYGWTEAVPNSKPAGTLAGEPGKAVKIPIVAPSYGVNTLWVKAIDATLNERVDFIEFDVAEPTGPVARWRLETRPGVDLADALADGADGKAGDTPLTAKGITWPDSTRMLQAKAASFDGTASTATTTTSVLNTTASYSVAAWVRPRDVNGFQTVVSKDGETGQHSPFRLQLRAGTSPRWCMVMNPSLTAADKVMACSDAEPVAGRWTHVAGTFNAVTDELRVWVDGRDWGTTIPAPQTSGGPIVLGRASDAGAPSDRFRGEIADVRLFDRVLVTEDFTGQRPDDAESGGERRPGMFEPTIVGSWSFTHVDDCYKQDGLCQTSDGTAWKRRLHLSVGGQGVGRGVQGGALQLDGELFPDDLEEGAPVPPSVEYGRTQRRVDSGPWTDTPVLRTDQSYTLSVWAVPDELDTMTLLSQGGTHQNALRLGMRSTTVGAATEARWYMRTTARDAAGATSTTAVSSAVMTDADLSDWTHLVAVYDAAQHRTRLYVDGEAVATSAAPTTWHSSGPLTVGAAVQPGGSLGDYWSGALDELKVFQGAMNDSQVAALHRDQVRRADD